MPVTSVSYFLGAGQPAFTTATSVGQPVFAEPIQGTTEIPQVAQKFWQAQGSYSPASLNTVATYLSTSYYLTSEEGFGEVGGGVMEWNRIYTRLLSPHTDYIGTMAFSFPGRQASATGSSITISAVSAIANNRAVYTSNSHGLTNGASILVNQTRTFPAGFGAVITWSAAAPVVVTAVTTNTFEGSSNFLNFGNNSTFVSGFFFNYAPATNVRTRETDAYIVNEYFLPGVSSGITSVADIGAIAPFSVTSAATGSEVDDYTCTAATSPTAAQYQAMVAAGTYIVASSIVERYAGNIYVRRTTYVRAL